MQLGAFCTAAPTWWMLPRRAPDDNVPSADTVARTRRCLSTTSVPGAISPRSTRLPNGMRAASRLFGVTAMPSGDAGRSRRTRPMAAST